MNTKSFINVFIILLCITGFAINSHAENKNNVIVKDVQYLKGDDFVQLFFKIDKMIPIPDVFYPDKNDSTRIIMRINKVGFQLGKDLLTFDSSVIDKVNIDNAPNYADVEIFLKEQVNYRVFTNRKGLYIEFPNVKILQAKADTKPAQVNPPKKQPEKPVISKKQPDLTTTPPKKQAPPAKVENRPEKAATPKVEPKPEPKVEAKVQPKEESPVFANEIKDIVLTHKDDESVKFDIIMTHPADFYVIPIPNEPVRLAIDFKNSQAKRIKKIVDQLNVVKIRGAYNTSSIFRVVFDLHYLKEYKISPKKGNKNILEVAFYNHTAPQDTQHYATAKPPAPVKKNVTQKEVNKPADNKGKKKKSVTPMADAGDIVKKANQKISRANTAKAEKKENKKQENNIKNNNKPAPPKTLELGKKEKSNIVITKNENGVQLEDKTTPLAERGIESVSPSPTEAIAKAPAIKPLINKTTTRDGIVQEDFFGDEASQVTQEKISDEPASETPPDPLNQISYLNQTIASGKKEYLGEPMGFNFHNADLKDVIKIIAKTSGLNIVMDPGISGRVTAQLSNVPWDQALELFLKVNGLDMVREGNILRIGSVDKLASEASRRRALRDARQMEDDLEVFTKTLSFASVKEVAAILKKQLSKRGEILEDARTNTLIISEIPDKILEMKKLIGVLDKANPQVSIEARIVETNANYVESFGIQWGYSFSADAAHGNQTTLKFPNSIQAAGNQFTSESSPLVGNLGGYAVNLPATGATSGTVFSFGNIANTFQLDVALSAMQTNGKGRIISAPKTTTQNNMEASIMQGKQIPVQTIQNNTITVVYRPAALELKVTPQITADGTVVTKLEIKNNSADFANLVNGIPPITTQSISTTVLVPDGGTIVIGGMYKVEKSDTKNGVPVLSQIPLLGSLFRSSTKRSEQKELLVFITPRIIK